MKMGSGASAPRRADGFHCHPRAAGNGHGFFTFTGKPLSVSVLVAPALIAGLLVLLGIGLFTARPVRELVEARTAPMQQAAPAEDPRPALQREPLKDYVQHWLNDRRDDMEKRTRGGDARPYPVFIVAAPGGGIRAAYWTAGVLAALQDADRGFARHVLAISGVSGGSVGAGIFAALMPRIGLQLHRRASGESAAGLPGNGGKRAGARFSGAHHLFDAVHGSGERRFPLAARSRHGAGAGGRAGMASRHRHRNPGPGVRHDVGRRQPREVARPVFQRHRCRFGGAAGARSGVDDIGRGDRFGAAVARSAEVRHEHRDGAGAPGFPM